MTVGFAHTVSLLMQERERRISYSWSEILLKNKNLKTNQWKMSDFIHPRATVYPVSKELSKAWGWLAWKWDIRFWDFGESVP
jgi:hypothetical protein